MPANTEVLDLEFDDVLRAVAHRPLHTVRCRSVAIDATYVKHRPRGRAVYVSIVTASAEREDGEPEPLGIAVGDSESVAFWTAFLADLRDRGLAGVERFCSANHGGLAEAVAEVFPESQWETAIVDLG